jgi:hypothetical protein
MHKYTPKYRPPLYGTVPNGFELMERPALGLGFDARTDLPASRHQFGVISYPEPLSEEDMERYQLEYA